MADLSRKTASIYINHQSAQDALVALQAQADKLQDKIRKGEAAGKAMVNEISKLNKVQNDIAAVQKQIDNGLRPSMNQLQTTVSKLRNELKRMSEDAPGYAEKFKAFQSANKELSRMQANLSGIKGESSKLSQVFGQFSSVFAFGGIAAASAGVLEFLKGSVEEAMQAEEQTARLKSTLDNLGRSDAFDRITQQSDELAKSIGYLDNDDINHVFEQLITYGKLTEGQMSQLAPIIIDFAAKTRMALPEATSTILKALEGNGKALKEYGINIKDAGSEEERFNIITTELAGKVKGAAAAFGDTFAGSLAISKQQLKDTQEEIGNNLIPTLQFLLGIVSGALEGLVNLGRKIGSAFSNTWKMITFQRPVLEIDEEAAAAIENFSNKVLSDMATKSIEVQKRMVESNKALLGQTIKDIDAFLKSSDAGNEARQKQLTQQYLEDRKIYEGSQLILRKSIEQQKQKDDEKAKAEHEKNMEEAKKRAEEAKRLAEQLAKEFNTLRTKILDEYDKIFLSSFSYQLKKINEEADAELASLKKTGKNRADYAELSVKIEATRLQKIKQLREKEFGYGTAGDPITTAEMRGPSTLKVNPIANPVTGFLNQQISALEKRLIYARGKDRLKLELDLLELQRQQEMNNTILTEEAKEGIRKKYDEKRRQLILDNFIQQAEQIVTGAQAALDIVKSFNEAANARDEQRIQESNDRANAEKQKNKRLLEDKIIDQQEYDRRIRAIDDKNRKETAKLKRQEFERNKKAEIIQAEISGAQAILSALQTKPFYLGLILAGVAAVKSFEQISSIKQKKAPEFGRGGFLDGPSHANGGMPVINPRTGQKQAEVEGGEVILSRNTVKNNPALVSQLLYSSMYGNGATIKPFWQTRPYMGLNYGSIHRTIDKVNHFERGGVFTADNQNNSQAFPVSQLIDSINQLNNQLKIPIKSYTVVSEVNAVNDTLDKISSDTVMKR